MAAKWPRKEKLSVLCYGDWKSADKNGVAVDGQWMRMQHDFDFEDAHWSSEAASAHKLAYDAIDQTPRAALGDFQEACCLILLLQLICEWLCWGGEQSVQHVCDCHYICLRSCHLLLRERTNTQRCNEVLFQLAVIMTTSSKSWKWEE